SARTAAANCRDGPGARRAREDPRMKLVVDQIECALGTIVLIAREGCLCWLGYADRRKPMMAALAARYAPLELANASNPFGLSDALHAYLAGDLDAISCLAVET